MIKGRSFIPNDVFRHILTFKDPTKQVGVKGGIKTGSAQCMPYYEFGSYNLDEMEEELFIWNKSAIVHRGTGQSSFVPRSTCGNYPLIWIYSMCGYVNYAFNTSRCCNSLESPASDLWMHCEACGPDLELYNIIRGV